MQFWHRLKNRESILMPSLFMQASVRHKKELHKNLKSAAEYVAQQPLARILQEDLCLQLLLNILRFPRHTSDNKPMT